MRVLLVALLTGLHVPGFGQTAWTDAATRGTGGAGTALESDSPYPPGPASLGRQRTASLGSTRLFGLAELTPVRAGVSTGGSSRRLAFSLSGLFLEGFSDARIGATIAFARPVGIMGLRAALVRRRAGPFPARTGLVASAGWRAHLSGRMSVGFALERGAGPGVPRDEVPTVSVGIAWSRGRLSVPVDLVRVGRAPPSLRAGAILAGPERLTLRLGASTLPDLLSAGFGLRFGAGHVDLAVDRHPDLGISIAVDVRWRLQ